MEMKGFDRNFDYVNEFIEKWNKEVRRFKYICLLLAAALIVIGICCICFPIETFALMQTFAAVALVVHGIYSIVEYASTTSYFKDPMHIVSGILNILLGLFLFFSPAALTATAFTFMFGFVLLFNGAEKISFANRLKYYRIMKTGMITFSGVISIILAFVFILMPLFSMLTLSYMVAAYLIVNGVALIFSALSMKTVDNRPL